MILLPVRAHVRNGRPVRAGAALHVTDPPGLADAQRRLSQLEHARKMSPHAQAVKLADRIANLHDTIHNPPDWSPAKLARYYDHSEALADCCGEAHPGLTAKVRELVRQGREKLAP